MCLVLTIPVKNKTMAPLAVGSKFMSRKITFTSRSYRNLICRTGESLVFAGSCLSTVGFVGCNTPKLDNGI